MQALYFADLDKKVVETRNPLMTVCVCVSGRSRCGARLRNPLGTLCVSICSRCGAVLIFVDSL